MNASKIGPAEAVLMESWSDCQPEDFTVSATRVSARLPQIAALVRAIAPTGDSTVTIEDLFHEGRGAVVSQPLFFRMLKVHDGKVDFLNFWRAIRQAIAIVGGPKSDAEGVIFELETVRDRALRHLESGDGRAIGTHALIVIVRDTAAMSSVPGFWKSALDSLERQGSAEMSRGELSAFMVSWLHDAAPWHSTSSRLGTASVPANPQIPAQRLPSPLRGRLNEACVESKTTSSSDTFAVPIGKFPLLSAAPPVAGKGSSLLGKAHPPATMPPPVKAALAPGKAPPFGKASGKGVPPGKPPPPKKACLPKKKAFSSSSLPVKPLPIGRRLAVKAQQGQAEIFRKALSIPGDASSRSRSATEGNLSSAVDLEALREAFAPRPRASSMSARERWSTLREPRVELLPRDVAQNVAIVLAKIRIDMAQLATALRELDPGVCRISTEEAARLLEVWPGPDLLQSMVEFAKAGGDMARLRNVERQLAPLVALPRAAPRLRLIVLVDRLDGRVEDVCKDAATVQLACSELQASAALRDLLGVILVLVNYVNFGTEAGDSEMRGLDVQSLLRLRETKAYHGDFPDFNMLHFVVKQLLRQRPELELADLDTELPSLSRAASLSFELMRQELARLRGDHAFVKEELRDHRDAYEEPAPVIPSVVVDSPPQTPPSPPSPPPPVPKLKQLDQFLASPEGSFGFDEVERVSGTGPAPQNPPVNPQLGFLRSLMARGQDFARFTQAWARGDEIIGLPEVDAAEKAGFGVVVSTDGEQPPPGSLWIHQQSGQWQLCWSEIRGPILVAYRTEGQRVLGTLYVVLTGADIVAFDSVYASREARTLVADAPHGFEIRNPHLRQIVRLCSSSAPETKRWLAALHRQAQLPGAGMLKLNQGSSRMFGGSTWKRYFCYLHAGTLFAYARARDGIEGTRPEREWPVSEASRSFSVRSFRSDTASAAARRAIADGTPFGFELGDLQAGVSWQFLCSSSVDERMWIRGLLSDEASRALGSAPAPSPSPRLGSTPVTASWSRSELYEIFAPEGWPANGPQRGSYEVGIACLNDLRQQLTPRCGEATVSKANANSISMQLNFDGENAQLSEGLAIRSEARESCSSVCDTLSAPADVDPASPFVRLFMQAAPLSTALPREGCETDGNDALFSTSVESSDSDSAAAECQVAALASQETTGTIDRLECLERRLANSVDRLGEALPAAEADCRSLLEFFGLGAPRGPQAGATAGKLLEALAEFLRQVRQAWQDIDRHARAAQRRAEQAKRHIRLSVGSDSNTSSVASPLARSSRPVPRLEVPRSDAAD